MVTIFDSKPYLLPRQSNAAQGLYRLDMYPRVIVDYYLVHEMNN